MPYYKTDPFNTKKPSSYVIFIPMLVYVCVFIINIMLQKTAISSPHTLRCLGKLVLWKLRMAKCQLPTSFIKIPSIHAGFFPFWNNFLLWLYLSPCPHFSGKRKDPLPKLVWQWWWTLFVTQDGSEGFEINLKHICSVFIYADLKVHPIQSLKEDVIIQLY